LVLTLVQQTQEKKARPMKIALALAAAALMAGCASMQSATCVQPDPVQPAVNSKCWNNGVNCGQGITPNVPQSN
jgi:uncharacterized lipoprotein YajG